LTWRFVTVAGCATHRGYDRVYDPYYTDYHVWDTHETVYYTQWKTEHNHDHVYFDKRHADEHTQYWTCRHSNLTNWDIVQM